MPHPESFDVLPPPPLPEFNDFEHFVRKCASLLRIARVRLSNPNESGGRVGGESGKRKRQQQQQGGGGRKLADVGFWCQFRKSGKVQVRGCLQSFVRARPC